MHQLNIVLFRDGRPGHEKQSWGIADALQGHLDCRIEERPVRSGASWSQVFGYLRLLSLTPSSPTIRAPSTLVLGTGSATHLPMLRYKSRYGCRAITCMNPGRMLRPRFDLCFIPQHDRVAPADNIVQTIGAPNQVQPSGSHDPARGLILVGGENRLTKSWAPDTIARQLRRVVNGSACTSWVVSSSPRTPDPVEDTLATLCSGRENMIFKRYRESAAGWVEQQYARVGEVWVTGDSMSMVYEALTAGCRVGIIPVAWKHQANKFARSIEALNKSGQVIMLEQLDRDACPVWGAAPPLAEAEKCAREVLRRWWPENLR